MLIGSRKTKGFTLIELSIVLVIVGLIAGGVLVGRDLIKSAEIRAQVSQIEQYNTAVRTFQLKYGGFPGDLSADKVSAFGFTVVPTRNGTMGEGNGDGLITPYGYTSLVAYTAACCNSGETAWFWEDLSINSGMISGNFNYASNVAYPLSTIQENTTPAIQDILPRGKINGVYVDVYSTGGTNYFSLLAFGSTGSLGTNGGVRNNATMLTPIDAYAIDKKIDDGMPQSGIVTAKYQQWDIAGQGATVASGVVWAAGGQVMGANSGAPSYGSTNNSTPPSATTCYDNAGGSGAQQYSVGYNGGTGQNCALSFRFY